MEVVFETTDGRRLNIELWYFDTVLDMKKKVQKYASIPVSSQTLVYNGQTMSDHLDIEFYNITLNSRIFVLVDVYHVSTDAKSPSTNAGGTCSAASPSPPGTAASRSSCPNTPSSTSSTAATKLEDKDNVGDSDGATSSAAKKPKLMKVGEAQFRHGTR